MLLRADIRRVAHPTGTVARPAQLEARRRGREPAAEEPCSRSAAVERSLCLSLPLRGPELESGAAGRGACSRLRRPSLSARGMPTRAQRRAEVLRQVEAVETLMDKVLGQLDTKCLCRAAGANRAWEQAASAAFFHAHDMSM